MSMLPVMALVLTLPQLLGYAVTRLAPRAGVPEWLAAAVAGYTGIWYPIFGRLVAPAGPGGHDGAMGSILGWAALLVGLLYQLVIGGVLATAVARRKRPTSP
jgi:hypothetical protein